MHEVGRVRNACGNPIEEIGEPQTVLCEKLPGCRCNLRTIDSRQRMKSPFHTRDARGMVAQKLDHPANESGQEKRSIATGKENGVNRSSKCIQAIDQSLQRATADNPVINQANVLPELGHFLIGGAHHDNRLDRFADEADYARQHQLFPERQPGLGTPHPPALAAAHNDTTHAEHIVILANRIPL
jgi:hypothetical protein